MLRFECRVAAEGRDENLGADSGDAGNMSPQNPEVAALDDQLLNGDELEVFGAVVKLQTVNNASGREVGLVESLNGDGAVAGLGKILHHGFARVGPDSGIENDEQADNDHGEHYDGDLLAAGEFWGAAMNQPECRLGSRGASRGRRRHAGWSPVCL